MRRYLRSLIRRRPRTRHATGNGLRNERRILQVDPLEERRLLTVSAIFSSGDLTVTGDANANDISVTFEDVSGTDYLIVKDGVTTIFDGTPSDQNVETSAVTGITVNGAAGDDAINLADVNTANSFSLAGGNVLISGDDDDDTITGSAFHDSLTGGSGSDTYVFGSGTFGGDLVTESANSDTDVLDFSAFGAGILMDLSSTSTQLFSGGSYVILSDATGIENAVGTAFGDLLTGNSRNNRIEGGGGTDVIDGDSGNDTLLGGDDGDFLTGGAGDDTLDGNAGTDFYVFAGSSLGADTIDESTSAEVDVLDFSGFGHGAAVSLNIDTQQDIDTSGTNLKLTLTNPDKLESILGSDYADSLTGNAGDNGFLGNGEDDTLTGLGGDDSYAYGDSGYGDDTIVEAADADNDELNFDDATVDLNLDLSITAAQSWNGGSITLSNGTGIEAVVGGEGNDTIVGNARDNTLSGFGGQDIITGGYGNDTLLGGLGGDAITTGLGSDVVDGGDGLDSLSYTGTESSSVVGSSASYIALSAYETVASTAVEILNIDTAGGDDWILMDESHLAGMGFFAFVLDAGAGEDTVILNSGNTGAFVGMALGTVIDLGEDDDLAVIYGTTGSPSLGSLINGGTGNDRLEIHELAADGIPAIEFNGDADDDTIKILDIASSSVTIHDDLIELSSSDNVEFTTTEQILLDSDNATAQVVTVGENTVALPAIIVDGDSTDTLDVTSAAGGTIDSTYDPGSGETSFVVDTTIADITSSGIKDFVLDSQTITFDGISADQYYDVTTNFIDPGTMQLDRDGHLYFEGALSVAGVTPASHATLINNNSNAILHGGFTSDSDIDISGTKYDVQYVSDVDFDDHEVSGGVQVTTSHIETYLESIPRFVYTWMETEASSVNRSIASGDWSTASNWSFGVVPTADDLVQITPGTTITYDANNASDDIKAIEILGSLVFDTTIDTHLLVGTIEVLPGGKLEIGSESAPISSSKEAIVTFADHIPYFDEISEGVSLDPSQHGTGLLGFGEVTIHGSAIGTYSDTEAQTWLRLSEVVLEDDDEIHLEAALPSGWDIGDLIVLPDTRQLTTSQDYLYKINGAGDPSQTEVFEIEYISMDRKTITLTTLAEYDHLGGQNNDQYTDPSPTEEYEVLPHIALLTRNVTLTSQEPEGYRGHTLYGGRADVDIRYANFEDLGRVVVDIPLDDPIDVGAAEDVPNQIARYGVHFHHLFGPVNPGNTGHQFTFVGNTSQANRTWGVTVHGSSYGLIADNVVYDVEGAGYVTEDGNEIGNEFLNNISVLVTGTLRDGENGGDNPASSEEWGIARGGSGFWFRRSGNDIIGNVAADNMYSGMTITSYYQFGALKLPNYRGANPTIASTPTLNNPAGTIEDNEFYGKSKHGLWIAYVGGDNIAEEVVPPEVVFEDLTLWNAGLGSFITMYHTASITFDNLIILSDVASQTRQDTGVVGINMRVYENLDTQILNSRIEGTFYGIIHAQSTGMPFGGPLEGTLVDDTVLKNYTNVVVLPSISHRFGSGNYLEISDTAFDRISLDQAVNVTGEDPPESLNIDMRGQGNSSSEGTMLNEFSIVKVTNYDQEAGENFQVFYKEQAADHIMGATDWSWFYRFAPAQIGAPAGSFYTNDELWGDDGGDPYPGWNMATFGFVAPSTASASDPEIDGLVGVIDEFLDPATYFTTPKVVIASPWEGSSYVGVAGALNDMRVNFNVLGSVPTDGEIRFEITPTGGTTSPYKVAPWNDSMWDNLAPGEYTLKGYVVDDLGAEVSGSAHSVTFDILSPQVVDVDLTPWSISDPKNEEDDIIGDSTDDVIGPQLEIRHMLMAAGGELYYGEGMAIIAESSPQGVWQYLLPGTGWSDMPAVSSTGALILPYVGRVRFVVDGSVTNPHSMAAPTLDFVMWDQEEEWDYLTKDTTTEDGFATEVVTVTLPLLA